MGELSTEMQGKDYDVVVIGGGINGVSSARELSRAGYSVLLADKEDFAAGASSRSSRMLHCGLRYFESSNPLLTFGLHPNRFLGALRMARASMEARHELALDVPERVRPFTMCFPLYEGEPIRSWHLDAGLGLLKQIGPKDPPLDYQRITGEFESKLPFTAHLRDRDKLQSIATYREYVFDWPERLCVDAALEAEQQGASLYTFSRARIVERDGMGNWCVELYPESRNEPVKVRASVVLNMAGSWIDAVNKDSSVSSSNRYVQATKGSHIIVRLPEAYKGFGIATIHRGGMPFYCLPSHDDFFYFGPTETLHEGEAREVSASDEDIDFLLGEANYLLPGLGLTRRDVEFTWAGLRPLTYDPQQPMGRRTRDIHDLGKQGFPNVLAMTAGPVMTHRSAGREMRDAVASRISPSKQTSGKTSVSNGLRSEVGVSAGEPDKMSKTRIVERAVRDEHARDLKGVLYTRTGWAWRHHLCRDEIEEVADVMAPLLDWSPERKAQEITDFINYQKTVFRTAVQDSARNAESYTSEQEKR